MCIRDSVSHTRCAAICADRFHAESALGEARAVSALVDATGKVRRDLHRLGLSAPRLRKVGGTRLPMGATLRREIRRGGSGALVLGDVELSLIHISEPTRLLSISYAVF